MVHLMVVLVLIASASLVCTNRVTPEDPNREPLDEYEDEYQYDDAEDSSHFSVFGQKNSKIKSSTVNYISNHEIRTFRPSTTKSLTSSPKSVSSTSTKYPKRQRITTTTTAKPKTTTTQTNSEVPAHKNLWAYKNRPSYTKHLATQTSPSSSTTRLIYDYKNRHVASSTIPPSNPKLINRRRKQPISNTISSKIKEQPTRTRNHINSTSSEEGSDDSLEKSESAPNFVTDTFAGNSYPFNEYSFNTYHYDSRKRDPIEEEERLLFTTDMSAPKFGSHEGNFGYFKPITKRPNPTISNKSKFIPVHNDFLSDLSVATLPLESYPSHLKFFKQGSTGVDLTSYEANDDFVGGNPEDDLDEGAVYYHHNQPSAASTPSPTSVASRNQINLYNDDVREQHEAKIEHQLRTSTNLADKAKYHQFLKAQNDERVEQQTKREQNHRPRPSYHHQHTFHNHHPHHQQHGKPVFRKPQRPISTPGLGNFRTHASDRASYHYPFI